MSAQSLFAAIPFSTATWLVLATLAFVVWLFTKAHRNPKSKVDWEDLLLDDKNRRTSPYKLGYLVGLIIGTWVVIQLSDKGSLTYDMLAVYLLYLIGGAGISQFTSNRGGNQGYDWQQPSSGYGEYQPPPEPSARPHAHRGADDPLAEGEPPRP